MKSEIEILSLPTKIREANVGIERGNVYSYPIHGHLYYEILVYDPFIGEITVNGEKFDTSTPTAILISPNDFHSITVDSNKNTSYYKIFIKRTYLEDFLGRFLESVVTQNQEQIKLLSTLCKEAYQNRLDLPYLDAYIKAIIFTIDKNAQRIPLYGKSVALIRQAIDLINSRFLEPITLQSTADELHVSPQYLSNSFSKYAHMSFIEYRIERRLHYATRLLQSGASVSEACFGSGYQNLSHFIRSFKRKYGITPSKYHTKNGHE